MNLTDLILAALANPLLLGVSLVAIGFWLTRRKHTTEGAISSKHPQPGPHCLVLGSAITQSPGLFELIGGVALFIVFAGIVPGGMIYRVRKSLFPSPDRNQSSKEPSNNSDPCLTVSGGGWESLYG